MPLSLTSGIVTVDYKTHQFWNVGNSITFADIPVFKQCLSLWVLSYAFHFVTNISAVFMLIITLTLVHKITGPFQEF